MEEETKLRINQEEEDVTDRWAGDQTGKPVDWLAGGGAGRSLIDWEQVN